MLCLHICVTWHVCVTYILHTLSSSDICIKLVVDVNYTIVGHEIHFASNKKIVTYYPQTQRVWLFVAGRW